jgi:hypothetical protein
MDNTGKVVTIELWNDSTGYAFGHPVFMAGSPIIMTLSAVEKYFKNNNMQYEPDVVHLSGGEVRISNALTGSNEKEVVRLDSLGEANYRFVPQNLTFTEEDDMALKTLTMTLLYDSTFYDVLREEANKPIDPMELLYPGETPYFDKYDGFVPDELVRKGFAYGTLDIEGMLDRIHQWTAHLLEG